MIRNGLICSFSPLRCGKSPDVEDKVRSESVDAKLCGRASSGLARKIMGAMQQSKGVLPMLPALSRSYIRIVHQGWDVLTRDGMFDGRKVRRGTTTKVAGYG